MTELDTNVLNDPEIQALQKHIVTEVKKEMEEGVIKDITDKMQDKQDADMKALEELMVEKTYEKLQKDYGWKPPEKKDFTFGHLVAKAHNRDTKDGVIVKADDFVTSVGGHMGFLMPDWQTSELLSADTGFEEIFYPRAMRLPKGKQPDAKLKIPSRGQLGTGLLDHIDFYQRAELAAAQQTDYDIGWIELEPTERAAYVRISNELLENAPVVTPLLYQLFREEQIFQNDYKFINGTGVNEPLGILKSDGRKEITRNTTLTIKYADIVKMRASMIPTSLKRCVWIANLGCREAIESMVDLNNRYIFGSGDVSKGYPETLSGLPIIFTDRLPAMGTTGDLCLVDLKYYLIKDGTGPAIESSNQVYFLNRATVVMMWWRNDGKPWLNKPILCRDGKTTISPFVVLKSNP